MIKDLLISFKDNFKDKTRNPFLGTYLIVWIIRNWELIYTLFNFDDTQKLNDKLTFIKNYYAEVSFLEGLLTNILWAFGLLILTYLLLNISRFITNLSEKQITPWVYKMTDSKSIVLKETYDNLRNENKQLELQLEKERESKGRLQNEISKLDEKIEKLNTKKEIKPDQVKSSTEQIKFKDEVDIMFDKIYQKNWSKDFMKISTKINESDYGWVKNDMINESVEYFIQLGLLDVKDKDDVDTAMEVSELGNQVLRRIRLEVL